MERVFFNADGEWLIVPQLGRLRIATELGVLELAPLEIAVIPRGLKFRVELLDPQARGYIAENHGATLRLPDLGPIGSNGPGSEERRGGKERVRTVEARGGA